ncbi:MAG: phosphate ABC transporter permease subunit PstC [Lachnospiraceae bacterium]|jgi:phosphate transport system permease protein|nr:phosphate ABC transporter permease subunit PstC [Lachnospiraceae bacterium]
MIKVKDRVLKGMVYISLGVTIFLFALIFIYLIIKSIPAINNIGLGGLINLKEKWYPIGATPTFNLLPAICGTLYTSFLATIFAFIFGLSAALMLNFYLPEKFANIIFSFLDMLAGVPSVVFGFIGLSTLVPFLLKHFNLSTGQCILAASIVLGVMLLPFIISTCSESIKLVRDRYEGMSKNAGISKEYFIIHIVFTSIKRSILAGLVMALGRAIGETMAVMMVIGNSAIFPKLLGRGQTIPGITALEMGSIGINEIHLSALYVANLILLIILLILILVSQLLKGNDRI